MRLFRNCASIWPVQINANFHSHWGERPWTPDGVYGDDVHESLRGKPRYRGVQHSQCPKAWSWWRLFAWYYVNSAKLRVAPPSTGSRLWIYTRWGAGYVDVFVDRRRPLATRR